MIIMIIMMIIMMILVLIDVVFDEDNKDQSMYLKRQYQQSLYTSNNSLHYLYKNN